MDATSISTIADGVIGLMRGCGYSDCSVERYAKVFRLIESRCPDGTYDADAVEAFAEARGPDGSEYSDDRRRLRRRVARLCREWAETGTVDLAARPPRERELPASDALRRELEAYRTSNAARGLAPGTVDAYHRLAVEFALHLESRGLSALAEADPASVLDFFPRMAGRWPNTSSASVASSLRPLLRHLGRRDLVDALSLARPHREHKVFDVLSPEDAEAVALTCVDGDACARDASISLLALTTGMRACDIVALELGDVDWARMSLSVTQQKTGNPLTVPMCAALAESLGRYILEERPESARREVFLGKRAPHLPLSDHAAVYMITGSVLGAAGAQGAGTRLLRRSVASGMVSAGVPGPVVSAVLGHADPDSTDAYIATDMDRMRECVLPLPRGAAS